MLSAGKEAGCAMPLMGKANTPSQKTVRHKFCMICFAGVDVLTLDLNITEFMQ
jgi:hypothetical protein